MSTAEIIVADVLVDEDGRELEIRHEFGNEQIVASIGGEILFTMEWGEFVDMAQRALEIWPMPTPDDDASGKQ